MRVKLNEWEPKFFHQKGWIGSNFPAKSNNGAMRWKKQTQTDKHLSYYQTNQQTTQNNNSSLQRQKMQSVELSKPATAPENGRSRGEMVDNLQSMGDNSKGWEEAPAQALSESKYSNFRTSVSNRKQLLYLKPYTRYQSQHLTLDQKKN